MNRLAKNRGAQTLVLLAFLAFFVHSLKFCRFRFENCDVCAACAKPTDGADCSANSAKTSSRAIRFDGDRKPLNSASFANFNAKCASDCNENRDDVCFLTFSPIKKTDSRVVFAALADAFAPSPISEPFASTSRFSDFNDNTVRADAVPLYLRWETLLI